MAQYLKVEVRDAIERAALDIFSEKGYLDTRMSDIAALAGLSSGNLYRYFENKETLFHSVVDRKFSASFLRLLRRRVRSLGNTLKSEPVEYEISLISEELLNFWIDHRLQVIIILRGAEGSEYEDFRSIVVNELRRLTLEYLTQKSQDGLTVQQKKDLKLLLQVIFDNTVTAIVEILASTEQKASIQRRIRSFWDYQIAGLNALSP